MDDRHLMMSIGDFARACGLTPKALRLYDETGLLVPAEVDAVSGYRWYAADQLDRARLVAQLRLAGMPLARIRVVADLPARSASAELTSYWRQVEADTATARRLVADLVVALSTKEHHMSSTTIHPTAAVRTGMGQRDTQEDAVYLGTRVFAAADGVGHADGVARAVVAELETLEGLDPAADPVTALDAVVARAAAVVAERYADQAGAASTLTAVVLGEDQMTLAHVGDTRAYLVRAGRLERLTRDHSVVQTLIDEGRLTPEEARTDDRRVQINRAIAADGRYLPDLAVHRVLPGDRIVLTTDGVHGRLDPAELTDLLVAEVSGDEVAATVENAVLEAGADDNYAVVVVDLGS